MSAMTMDRAWALADSALPAAWALYLRPELGGPGYIAEGRWRGIWRLADGPLPSVEATGSTPTEALLELADKLRAL